MSRSAGKSPFAQTSPAGRRALYLLGLLGAAKALALVLLADALAQGIVSAIEGTDAWRSALVWGAAAGLARVLIVWATSIVTLRAAIGEKAAHRAALARRLLERGGRDIERGTGEITTLATRGLDDLDNYFTQYLPSLVNAATIPLLIGARILSADLLSAVIIVLTIPLIPVFMVLIGQQTRDRVSEAADALGRLSNHLVELARGLPVLIGLGRAGDQIEALTGISERYRQRTLATLRVAFLSALALELIAMISVAVVAVFIGVRLVHGEMSLEVGLLVLILAPECYLPFREVGAAHHASEDGMEALTRVRSLVEQPAARLAHVNGDATESGVIRVEGLAVRYPQRSEAAVSGLSFTVRTGELLAMTGPSGGGKSTVIAALAGLLGDTTAAHGEAGVRINGAIRGVDLDRLAWVSQHPVIFSESVRDELALAAAGSDVKIPAILRDLAIEHLIDRHPAELSPGELRRVAFARALVRIEAGATLLLLDEPTAHLDDRSAAIIAAGISRLRGRVTTIISTHDPRIRRLADATLLIGRRAESMPDSGDAGVLPPAGEPAMIQSVPELETVTASRSEARLSMRGMLVALDELFSLRTRQVALALLFGTLAALSAIALASLSGWLIVRASQQPPILLLLTAIVGVRFFGVGRAAFRYAERLFMHDAALTGATRLRVLLWQALAAQGPAVKRRLQGGSTLDALVGDVDRLRDLVPRVLPPPVVGLTTAASVTLALGLIHPLTLPVMIPASLVALVIAPLAGQRADRRAGVATLQLRSRGLRRFAALAGAAADLRVNGMDRVALQQIVEIDDRASTSERRSAWAEGIANSLVTAACIAATLAMIAISVPAVRQNDISPEMVAVLVLTPLAMIDPFMLAANALQQLPALETLLIRFRWLHEAPASDPAMELLPAFPQVHNLVLENVAARWPGQPAPVFTGVNAGIGRGEWLTVTGRSGTGKSTLLAVLMGFLRPETGVYRLNGTDIADLTPARYRPRFAWCPQEAHLFDSSLRANLLLARPRGQAPDDAELRAALAFVGLGPLLDQMPAGLDTRIGSEGAGLSGGQRQRVAIARTLLTGADVLLIDEPTAHLDRPSASGLMRDLHAALSDHLVVAVTHHPDDLWPDDRRLVLEPEGQPVTPAVESRPAVDVARGPA